MLISPHDLVEMCYTRRMANKKPANQGRPVPDPNKSAPRGNPVSLYPLTPEQAIRGMFQISKEDVARIVASKPEKKAGGKGKGRKK